MITVRFYRRSYVAGCLAAVLLLYASAASADSGRNSVSCNKQVKTLLEDAYKFSSVLTLLSPDGRELAVFVKFYQLEKMRGRVFKQINISHKLLRYDLEPQNPTLISEQGTCGNYFDIEHHRGFYDSSGGVFLYSRKGKGFSLWPRSVKNPITFKPIVGANFNAARFAFQPGSELIYAIAGKRIYRNDRGQSGLFREWRRFDDLVGPEEKWNPQHIRATTNRVSVLLYLWNVKQGFKGRQELLSLDAKGTLAKRQKVNSKHLNRIHGGPPAVATTLKLAHEPQSRDSFFILSALDINTGTPREIIQLPAHYGLKHRTIAVSRNGDVFGVYDSSKAGPDDAALQMVLYDKQNDRISKVLLPLLSEAND